MIKFFRRIRQRLLSENRFSKYLIYAVGEIALVIIGILIALQINNWNETKKSEALNDRLLAKVQNELLQNIQELTRVIEFYRGRDTLQTKVLKKQVDINDYKKNPTYFYVIKNFNIANLSQEAYAELAKNNSKIENKDSTIISQLKDIYNKDFKNIEMANNEIKEMAMNFYNESRLSKEWYHHFTTKSMPEILNNKSIMDYYLNDPYYLNNVEMFQTMATYNLTSMMVIMRSKLIKTCANLSEYLDTNNEALVFNDSKKFKHYIGTYLSEGRTGYKISDNNGQLAINFKGVNDSIFGSAFNIYPQDKTHFTIDFSNGFRFGKFIFDDDQNVKSFISYRGFINNTEFKKVE